MGGVIFALPALIAALAFAQNDTRWDFLLIAVVCAVGFGLVGFVDDFIKVKLHRSLGSRPNRSWRRRRSSPSGFPSGRTSTR